MDETGCKEKEQQFENSGRIGFLSVENLEKFEGKLFQKSNNTNY